MAGYCGYSMSNNAVQAYADGERPFSRWTKKEILEIIEDMMKTKELTLLCSMEKLRKTPAEVLKNACLSYSSWHHTSNHYNRTDFYSVSPEKIARLTDELLEEKIKESKAEKEEKEKEEKWRCVFLEWGGTRRHPKATEITEDGIVKGDWFIRANGQKKKTTANGFRFLEKLE